MQIPRAFVIENKREEGARGKRNTEDELIIIRAKRVPEDEIIVKNNSFDR